MARVKLGRDVFEAGYDRFHSLFRRGHRVVVSFSGGKDSTVCLELAIMAARETGQLPVDVILQDEEVAFPGVYEFIERTARRTEVRMHWLVMQQPMLNIFNRSVPYFWVMDPLLSPEQWLRRPPEFAEFVKDKAIELMTNPKRFPVEHAPRRQRWDQNEERQCLINVIGLRTQESAKRLLGLHSSGGFITSSNDLGAFACRPIYDWKDGDVWRFIKEQRVDYCRAYDVFVRMGLKGAALRIGPPTLNMHSARLLQVASRAWPNWFDRVCARVPGVRLAALYGPRVVQPYRRVGESWKECFHRECLGPGTPKWIRERAAHFMDKHLKVHATHSRAPFPEAGLCGSCGIVGSWHAAVHALWGGDPYCLKTAGVLEMVEPEFFRPGAGTWAGDWAEQVGHKIKVMF